MTASNGAPKGPHCQAATRPRPVMIVRPAARNRENRPLPDRRPTTHSQTLDSRGRRTGWCEMPTAKDHRDPATATQPISLATVTPQPIFMCTTLVLRIQSDQLGAAFLTMQGNQNAAPNGGSACGYQGEPSRRRQPCGPWSAPHAVARSAYLYIAAVREMCAHAAVVPFLKWGLMLLMSACRWW